MATLYPESLLEDVVAAWIAANAAPGGKLAGLVAAGAVFKGFGAAEASTPCLVVGVAGSAEDPSTGNFNCRLSVSVRCSPDEPGVRANQTAREAELRDLLRTPGIETALDAVSAGLGGGLRVQWWEPKGMERGVVDGDFASAAEVEVETYFATEE